MKKLILCTSVIWVLFSTGAYACTQSASVCFEKDSGMALISNGQPVDIVISAHADPAVKRVANAFAKDMQRVGGGKSKVSHGSLASGEPAVIIGVLGNNALIDELVAKGKLDVSAIKGKWEAYTIAVVAHPWPGVEKILVVAGADRRGAVFGTYTLSEQMGVSPWYWFADVPTKTRKNVYITAGSFHDAPVVRYRGIFINDEDPALKGWAEKLFGGVNAGMYERVFELILRLKGNYIWPAMWGKAFHLDDPENTVLADDMGMVIGTSHHEPMTRAHDEWHRKSENPQGGGPWDYATNKDNIRKFWRGGIARMMAKGQGAAYDSLVTVGMRGDGDEPMSEGTAIELLEQVVEDQRHIIAQVTGKPAEQTPQVWALYKEVQDYYDKGMTVPADVTLLFADDNWGQIRRLPTKNIEREGGFGVYYHFDYVGAPRNYKWTNTVQIGKVWQQMDLAYQRGAKELWIVNVGDLKPVEMPIDFFLTMAWNPEKMSPAALHQYTTEFAEQSFGGDLAQPIGDLLQRYGTYAATRKPELLNQDAFAIGGIAQPKLKGAAFYQHYKKWQKLAADMQHIKQQINKDQYPAFFQLVEWPIASMSNLYEMYFAAAWNKKLAQAGDARANYFQELVETNFAKDAALTGQYHQINNGKWDGMINQVHMSYESWNDPAKQTMPPVFTVHSDKNDIAVQFEPMALPDNRQIIPATDYIHATHSKGFTWTRIDGLGQANAGVVALPQGQASTNIKDDISLTYSINQPYNGEAKVTIELSPTLDTMGRGGIRLGVGIDDRPVEILSYDLHATSGAQRTTQEKAWTKAVINNQHKLEVTFTNLSKGKHKLKIVRIDDNIILEKLMVTSAPNRSL